MKKISSKEILKKILTSEISCVSGELFSEEQKQDIRIEMIIQHLSLDGNFYNESTHTYSPNADKIKQAVWEALKPRFKVNRNASEAVMEGFNALIDGLAEEKEDIPKQMIDQRKKQRQLSSEISEADALVRIKTLISLTCDTAKGSDELNRVIIKAITVIINDVNNYNGKPHTLRDYTSKQLRCELLLRRINQDGS